MLTPALIIDLQQGGNNKYTYDTELKVVIGFVKEKLYSLKGIHLARVVTKLRFWGRVGVKL